jgi:hypothetical protein
MYTCILFYIYCMYLYIARTIPHIFLCMYIRIGIYITFDMTTIYYDHL